MVELCAIKTLFKSGVFPKWKFTEANELSQNQLCMNKAPFKDHGCYFRLTGGVDKKLISHMRGHLIKSF